MNKTETVFKVGGLYKSLFSGVTWEILYIGNNDCFARCVAVDGKGFFKPGDEHILNIKVRNRFVEVKPKRVMYVNVYPLFGAGHYSKEIADERNQGNRIARVRVEFEEGQFDD